MARYEMNHSDMARWLLSDDMRDLLEPEAERIADRVRANTPVRSGETRASVRVEKHGHLSNKGDRVAVRVVAGGAMPALEFGNKRVAAQRPMRRAIE